VLEPDIGWVIPSPVAIAPLTAIVAWRWLQRRLTARRSESTSRPGPAPWTVFLDTDVIRHVANLRLGRAQPTLDRAELVAADELFRLSEWKNVVLQVPDVVRRQTYGDADEQLQAMLLQLLALCQVDRMMTHPIEFPIVDWSEREAETIRRIQSETTRFMQPNARDLCAAAAAAGAPLVVTFDRGIARPDGQAYRYFEREFSLRIVMSPSYALAFVTSPTRSTCLQ